MAEIIDHDGKSHEVATNCKANTALGLGIAGTALGLLGGGLCMTKGWGTGCGWNNAGYGFYNRGFNGGSMGSEAATMTSEDLYIERKECHDQLENTKEIYKSKIENQKALADAFFDAYKRDADNSFGLYKSQRDGFDILNQKMIDSSFGLYKNQRDEKDELVAKINEVDKKVDMMAAIRPYQDALINCKIDKASLIADFNLAKRTCRMIEGTLVLPSDENITGYPSNQFYRTSAMTL